MQKKKNLYFCCDISLLFCFVTRLQTPFILRNEMFLESQFMSSGMIKNLAREEALKLDAG